MASTPTTTTATNSNTCPGTTLSLFALRTLKWPLAVGLPRPDNIGHTITTSSNFNDNQSFFVDEPTNLVNGTCGVAQFATHKCFIADT
jgi:hypothetical protein